MTRWAVLVPAMMVSLLWAAAWTPLPAQYVRTARTVITDSTRHMEWKEGERTVVVDIVGRVQWKGPGELDQLSDDGSVRIMEQVGATARAVEILRAAASPGLEYIFRLNGEARPFDRDAQRWLRGMLVEIRRNIELERR